MTAIIVAGGVILALITIAFVLYPVFRASAVGRRHFIDSVAGDRLAELIAQRDAVYEAIRDVDFDRATGKLTAEDHRRMRERLTAEGVRLLQELDRRMQSDLREELEQEIEREVAALRQAWRAAVSQEGVERPRPPRPAIRPRLAEVDDRSVVCHECGGGVRAGVRFCTHCGASLALTCPECGKPFEPGDRFCSGCGASLSNAGELTEALQTDAAE